MGTEHAAGAVSAAVLPFQSGRFTGSPGNRIKPPFSSSAAKKGREHAVLYRWCGGGGGAGEWDEDLSLKIPKVEESGDLFSLVLRVFTSMKGGGYKEANSSSTKRITARVSCGCWSAWPDLKGHRAPPAPAGSGREPITRGRRAGCKGD